MKGLYWLQLAAASLLTLSAENFLYAFCEEIAFAVFCAAI